MSSVYLVGFMGSGKSATAEALAERIGCSALDLDAKVVDYFGMPIAEIFVQHGERAFRVAESNLLEAVVTSSAQKVVALGGGTFLSESNRTRISASGGVSVFLDLPWKVIAGRLPAEDLSRPLFDPQNAESLYADRREAYQQATVSVALSGSENPALVAERITFALEEVVCAT